MTAYHAFQATVSAVILAVVAWQVRRFLQATALDAEIYLSVVERAVADHDRRALHGLAATESGAFLVEMARASLDHPSAELGLDDTATDLRARALQIVSPFRPMARISTATGLMGAVLEGIWLLRGDHGLAGLVAGRPERLAFEHAVLSMAIGIVVAAVCVSVSRTLRREIVGLVKSLDRAHRCLARLRTARNPSDTPSNRSQTYSAARW